jgi:hypothetical protein
MVTNSHIARGMLGLAQHENVLSCAEPCLGLVKNLSDTTRSTKRSCRAVSAPRPGPSLSSTSNHTSDA